MTASIAYWLKRALNGIAKVGAGLTPFGESVWPGVENDLYIAHRSIYQYFGRSCADCHVLDLGCGSGYGAAMLHAAGARTVIGVDIDARSVTYARKHFQSDAVRFIHADLETLSNPGVFDRIVSSNAFEHLSDPGALLARCRAWLAPGGEILLALPPIFGHADLVAHAGIHYHRSNLAVDEWLELFERGGWSVDVIAHRLSSSDVHADFASPFRSRLSTADFVFTPSSRDDLYASGAITAVYRLR